jgi:hypothetical protein
MTFGSYLVNRFVASSLQVVGTRYVSVGAARTRELASALVFREKVTCICSVT